MGRPTDLRLPNLILLGAQKSGTSTLHEMLRTHPDVEMSTPKELGVFAWRDWRDQLGRFEGQYTDRATVRGEGTPLYLHDPEGPAKFRSLGEDLRFICILRHPTDRAYSQYWHSVRAGWERLPFEEAVATEPDRIRGFEPWRRYAYVTRGYYHRYVQPYQDAFGDRLLVLGLPDLLADPRGTMRRVYEFLDLDPAPAEQARLVRANPARRPRNMALSAFSSRLRGNPVTRPAARVLNRLNVVERPYPSMDPDTRATLDAAFEGVLGWARATYGVELARADDGAAGRPRADLRVAGEDRLWFEPIAAGRGAKV